MGWVGWQWAEGWEWRGYGPERDLDAIFKSGTTSILHSSFLFLRLLSVFPLLFPRRHPRDRILPRLPFSHDQLQQDDPESVAWSDLNPTSSPFADPSVRHEGSLMFPEIRYLLPCREHWPAILRKISPFNLDILREISSD